MACVGLAGCGGEPLPAYTSSEQNLSPATGESGVAVAAYLMRDKTLQEKYFGIYLTEANITPCLISIKNDTSTDLVYFNAEDLALAFNSIQRGPETNASSVPETHGQGMLTAGASVALVGAALVAPGLQLIALPFILIGAAKMANSQEVKRNILAKQMFNKTLYPGEAASGFVYLKNPAGGIPQPSALTVNIRRRAGLAAPERASAYSVSI